MKSRLLKNAKKQFKLGNYSQVIRILEPEVFGNRENEYFYFYLGFSCLFLGDYSGANSYLRRALQINPSGSATMLGIAVIHLKYNKPSEAIRIWLDILDRDPKNRFAKRSLDIIKKSEALERVPEDFLSKNLYKLVPFRRSIIGYRILRYAMILIVIIALSSGLFFSTRYLLTRFGRKNNILSEITISRNLQEHNLLYCTRVATKFKDGKLVRYLAGTCPVLVRNLSGPVRSMRHHHTEMVPGFIQRERNFQTFFEPLPDSYKARAVFFNFSNKIKRLGQQLSVKGAFAQTVVMFKIMTKFQIPLDRCPDRVYYKGRKTIET